MTDSPRASADSSQPATMRGSTLDSTLDALEAQRLSVQAIPYPQALPAPEGPPERPTMPPLSTPPASHTPITTVITAPITTAEWTRRRDIMLTLLLWTLAIGLAFWLLAHVQRVFLLLVLSGLIAFALAPLTKLLTRFLPRPVAIILVYCVMLGTLGGLGYLVVSVALAEGATFIHQVHYFLAAGPHSASSPLVQKLKALGISQQQIDQLTSQLEGQAQMAVPLLGQFVNDTLSVVIDSVLVLVLSIYLLVDGARFGSWLRTTAPLKQRSRVVFLLISVQTVVGGYIRGQLILSTLIGLLVGLGMAVLQVPYAILLGVLAFLLEFIPTVGTLTSGVVCILVAATQSWQLALLVLAYFVCMHVLEGYVVAPRVLGKAVGLHPAISILALVAGADLFGLWGAIFAAPLAGLLQVLLTAVWQAWREQNPGQFPDMFGSVSAPVTTAEAHGESLRPPQLPAQPVENESVI